ncbi:hypothetical protein Cpap_1195 [Ruminiclostridium papyrosolvens DSM 2782]|uniref:Uncharacterized protein n=1 Tax=Ruminiclostridium papyrosolvens DSM 2782 TaxID=588581 RepID=F1TF62_9FIRM|nr:DUF6365 family protein [Ruminiclostridium papyrosolvens]EGD47000.1 hypothetical protein Cpap_1195 [Ruminiclostridium papyrosolvens DSM 2782]WES33751.1 DUF6365 family protein [Ruminiclostridium papyrosolvens DSM 2782]
MIKIVFVVLGEISAGELTIAYEFASRLLPNQFDSYFLIPEKNKSFLEDNGMKYFALSIWEDPERNKKNINKFLNNISPDYFIVSDVYTLEYSQAWTGLNYKSLQEYGVPIIGIDEYEYLSTDYNIDYYGGIVKAVPDLLDHCDYVLRNCPLNTVRPSKPNVKYFSLCRNNLSLNSIEKYKIRQELEIDDDEKVIFIPNSKWEMLNVHRLPALGVFQKSLPVLLSNYLCSVHGKITILHVGPEKWTGIEKSNVKYHNFNYLPPQIFNSYLLASDLFITTNVVSVTLSRAVFGTVPSIVFQNYKRIDFSKLKGRVNQMDDWYQKLAKDIKIAYPFRAGIFGWSNFLKPVLQDNGYVNTYVESPLFKVAETMEKLEQYLYDQESINKLKERQLNYIDNVLSLPGPDKIMSDIINKTRGGDFE